MKPSLDNLSKILTGNLTKSLILGTLRLLSVYPRWIQNPKRGKYPSTDSYFTNTPPGF